jgi:phospholipid/cholesterol/gamma-HCH transport system substrate-binding protein
MSQLTNTQRFRLGIFVSSMGIILIILFVIPMGFKLSNKEKNYYAYFSGESMSGLELGSVVKYHGVPIGKVTKIAYDPKNISRIKVEIRIQYDFPMKKDMYAQCWSMGITGLNYIDIMGGSNEAEELPPNSEIPTKVSLISSITGKIDIIMSKVELLLNHLNNITQPESLMSIKKILYNLEEVTADAKSFFKNTSPNVSEMSKTARVALTKIDSIAGDIHTLSSAFNKSLSEQKLNQIVTRLDSTIITINNLSQTLLLMVRQNREDISVSMQNLREALENANQLINVLSENPSLLLKGEQQKERER